MLEWIVAIIAIVIGVIFAAPRLLGLALTWHIRRTAKEMVIATDDPVLAQLTAGKPAVIYFTADWCAPCRTVQSPAIERLQAEAGEALQIIKINADENQEIAKRWQVMSLPRTFILNSRHQIYAMNLEAVNEAVLKAQLEAAENAPADAAMLVNS